MFGLRMNNSTIILILLVSILVLTQPSTITKASCQQTSYDLFADQQDASSPISILVALIPTLPPDIIVKTQFNVEITIINEGEKPIYDIEVTPSMPEAELIAEYLRYLEPSLGPNKKAKYIFCFYAKSAGNFTMDINVSYKGSDGKYYSQNKEVEVLVVSPPAPISASLVVPRKISFGDTFETKVWVTNEGEYPISSIEVDLASLGISIISEQPKVMSLIGQKETEGFSFLVEAIAVGNFTLTTNVSYRDFGGERLLKTENIDITITKTATIISSSISPEAIHIGDEITISGQIFPPLEGDIHLTFIRPDKTQDEVDIQSSVEGKFLYTYTPKQEGRYVVEITWLGDLEHEPASTEISFDVGKACIIATSTYGSEMAPEVQFLRGFRDKTVYSTFAGTQFMQVFNAWYYSFSPSVAPFIASNPPTKTVMKGVLYPLMSILHLSTETYSLFGVNVEIGIVVAGLVASSLIAAFYFVPPSVIGLVALKRYGKRLPKVGQLKPFVIPWLGSIALILLAEVTFSQALMMVSAGAFVVLTIVLTAGAIALSILHQLK